MDLQAIEARLAAATPGPWRRPEPKIYDSYVALEDCICANGWDNGESRITLEESGLEDEDGNEYHRHTETDYHHVIGSNGHGVTGNYDWEAGGIMEEADTEFIAHAPEDIRALLGEVTDLRVKLEAAQHQIEEVTGVQGEHYPCKPDIFAATYEPVEVSDQPLNPPNEGEWLDQAVEAAAETQFLSRYPDSSAWSGATPWEKSEWHRKSRITILAALPHIREYIAQEIEVHMRRHDNAQIGFSAVGDAYADAARIARGKEQEQ